MEITSQIFIGKAILIVVIFALTLGLAMYSTYAERKIAAFMQDRIGPDRAGPFGLLQPLADVSESKSLVKRVFGPIENAKPPKVTPYFTENENEWIDSTLNRMTLDQKIGQFFMLAAYSNQGEGTPAVQARLTNRYQSVAKVPLLISFDGEWGLGMRLSNVISYPK
ncbi:hypothetical protein B566_EDAN019135, partial [Ephemera danica]